MIEPALLIGSQTHVAQIQKVTEPEVIDGRGRLSYVPRLVVEWDQVRSCCFQDDQGAGITGQR